MKSIYLAIITIALAAFTSVAQTMDELVNDPDYIKTVVFNQDAQEMLPIYKLGDRISLSFDDVIGDEADYYYRFEHYDYDWQPSRLFKNEWLKGIDDVRIIDYKNSREFTKK